MTPPPLATTAIGSLPHREVEPALVAAFRLDIPCLPSLPLRSPTELLVPQGLAGLPGLEVDASGRCVVDPDRWRQGRLELQRALKRTIDDPRSEDPLMANTGAFAAWELFLKSVDAKRPAFAKVQLVGPLTAARYAFLSDGRTLVADLQISNQVFQLLAARALVMIAAVQRAGAQPIFFFDEPALNGLSLTAARNLLALQELRVSVRALRRAGAWVGLHCCGEAQWERILPLGLDFVSFDAKLSLAAVLRRRAELDAFAAGGGRLGLGLIPTDPGSAAPDPERVAAAIHESFTEQGALDMLRAALLTPACGLAGHSATEADATLESLAEVQRALARRLALT